jgi:hypothetical protein
VKRASEYCAERFLDSPRGVPILSSVGMITGKTCSNRSLMTSRPYQVTSVNGANVSAWHKGDGRTIVVIETGTRPLS